MIEDMKWRGWYEVHAINERTGETHTIAAADTFEEAQREFAKLPYAVAIDRWAYNPYRDMHEPVETMQVGENY